MSGITDEELTKNALRDARAQLQRLADELEVERGRVHDGHVVAKMLIRKLGGRVVLTRAEMVNEPKGTLVVAPDQSDPLSGDLVMTVLEPA